MWELDIDVGGSVDRERLSWYHWDGGREYVGAKNEVLEKESELGEGTFANRGKS